MAVETLRDVDRKLRADKLEMSRMREDIRLLRERISSATGASSPSTVFSASEVAGTITAGAGLTGGGTLPGTATLNVGAGDGIGIAADSVAVSLSSPSGLGFGIGGGLEVSDFLAGDGLTISNKVIDVQVGDGIALVDEYVTADLQTDSGMVLGASGMALGTPTTLTVLTVNSVTSNTHSHGITHSANPGASQSILSSSAAGYLQLVRVGLGTSPSVPLHSLSGSGAQARFGFDVSNYTDFITTAAGVLGVWPTANALNFHNDANNYIQMRANADGSIEFEPVTSGLGTPTITIYYDENTWTNLEINASGTFTIQPQGDLVLTPGGKDVRPLYNYDVNLGTPTAMWLSLHAAELWVQYLIAAYTMATIGGRVLVGPTTYLTEDLDAIITVANADFESRTGNDFNDWTETSYGGTITAETVHVYSGSSAVKLQSSSGGGVAEILKWTGQFITVTPGETYELVFYTRGNGSHVGRYYVWDQTNSTNIVPFSSTGVSGTTYTRVSRIFTVPANCTEIGVAFRSNQAANAVAYFDAVAIRPATMVTEHNNLAVNDNCHLEYGGFVEFMKVVSGPTGSGPYTYTVNRDLDGTGANDWPTGRAVFNTGVIGDGFIDLYSLQGVLTGYGPTIVGNVRFGNEYNQWTSHWAIGNLENLYDYASTTYGAAFGRYLSGHTWMSIDAVDGIRIMNYNTILAQWDMSGDILIGRDGIAQSNIYITSNAIFLRTGTFENIALYTTGSASFGYVTDNQANMFWNNTNKRLEFRGGAAGAEVQIYVDTNGSLVAGGVVLDSSGLSIASGEVVLTASGISIETGNAQENELKFVSSGVTKAKLYALSDALVNDLHLFSSGSTISGQSRILLDADAGSGEAFLYVRAALNDDSASYVSMGTGATTYFRVRSDFIYLDTDARISGGLAVGSLVANPPTGTICITDGITAPGTVSGMAVIYVDTADGDLKVRFGSGTVKTIATDP